MYTTMDEDVFLAPESIIAGVLEADWTDDPTAELDFGAPSWDGATEED